MGSKDVHDFVSMLRLWILVMGGGLDKKLLKPTPIKRHIIFMIFE